jgi:hypothetical protein
MERVPEEIFNRAKLELEAKVGVASDMLGAEISVGADEGVFLPELEITPDKPNSARSVAQLRVAGKTAGDLYVIVFGKGDSTGAVSDKYPAGSLEVPEELISRSGLLGSYPRPKTQLAEICIPLANARVWEKEAAKVTYYQGTALRILGLEHLEDGGVARVAAVDEDKSSHVIGWGSSIQAHAKNPSFLTLGTDSFGRRVGDPHAIFNPSVHIQVAGFVAVESPEWFDLLASFDPVNPYNN